MKRQDFWSTNSDASCIQGANDPTDGPRCAEAGFALVEILISLVLLALLLSLMPATVRMARQAWQAEAQLERSAALSTAADTLRRTLTTAVPLPAPRVVGQPPALVFDGQPESIAFVAPAPAGLEGGGLLIFTVRSKPRLGGAGHDLVLTVSPYSPDARDAQESSDRSVRSETVLAQEIEQLRLRYFGPSLDGRERIWHDSWAGRASLPLMVDVRFSLSRSSRLPEQIAVAPRYAQSN